MKLAIPIWQARVSPVFDVARHCAIIELEDGAERARTEVSVMEEDAAERTSRLVVLGVETLICGAISKTLEMMLLASGITVIPRICGDADEVLRAFCRGTLDDDRYVLPGCGGCQGRRQGRRPRQCPKSRIAARNTEELPHPKKSEQRSR